MTLRNCGEPAGFSRLVASFMAGAVRPAEPAITGGAAGADLPTMSGVEEDPLRVEVRPAGAAVQVVRATGALDLATVTALRTGAEKALAQQPELLVIDLSGVVLGNKLAARVLPLIAAQAAVWPVTRVAFAGAAAEIERSLRRTTALTPLRWFSDVTAARSTVSEPPVTIRMVLPHGPEAAATARRSVAGVHADDDTRDRAEIVVTELVGNAVQHAREPLELRIVNTGRLHISVRDGEPGLADTDGGYGLDVVRRFAIVWGWRPVAGGKVVWAVVGPTPRVDRSVRLTCSR